MHSLCIGHDLEGTLHDNDIRILPVVNLGSLDLSADVLKSLKLRAHDDERALNWLCSLAVVHRRSKGEDPADRECVNCYFWMVGLRALVYARERWIL